MLVRWTNAEPTQRMVDGWNRLNRLFDDTFGLASEVGTRAWVPAVDVAEDQKSYTLALELPGVKAEDVSIELVDGNRLSVRGEKKQQLEEKTDRVHRFERSFGSFQRVFVLPDTVDGERIEARSENGVLTITVPKTERAKPREIPIRTS